MAISLESKRIAISDLYKRRLFKEPKTILLSWESFMSRPDKEIEQQVVLEYTGLEYVQIGYFLSSEPSKRYVYPVQLVRSRNCFKGYRYYFICPLLKQNGMPCRKRVAVLYRPEGRIYFGCRLCHKILYPTQLVNHESGEYTEVKRSILERKIEDLEGSIVRERYKGRKTRKQMRLERLYKEANCYPSIVYQFTR